jgi:hypothetical protein
MTPQEEIAGALEEVAAAVLDAPDPGATLGRLRRWARREAAFGRSPAAQPIDDIVAAKTAGHDVNTVANRRRVYVSDNPRRGEQR